MSDLINRDELYDNICALTTLMRSAECDDFTKNFIDVFCEKIEEMIIDAPSIEQLKEQNNE